MGTHRTYTIPVVGWDANDQAAYPGGVATSGLNVDPNRCMRAKQRNVTRGSVRVREALVIRATPDRLAALYLDYRSWPELFPATIRGVRWLEEHHGDITVEVDHHTEGRVVNIIRPMSASVIALEEFKPRYDATFVNRFERAEQGTRYILDAEIRFHMPYALIAPFLQGVVRNRLRRFVLEPMRAEAERERPRRKIRSPQAARTT